MIHVQLDEPKMKGFLDNFPSAKLSIYTTVIVIFTYNVLLEKDVPCTCKPQQYQCNLYMWLPFGLIFFLILWMDKKFLRIWKYNCTCICRPCSRSTLCGWCKQQLCDSVLCGWCCNPFFWVLLRHILKAGLVGLLWVASVLIDGDWYVCCQNDQSEQQAQLACKRKDIITAEEQTIIAELKNSSKVSVFTL